MTTFVISPPALAPRRAGSLTALLSVLGAAALFTAGCGGGGGAGAGGDGSSTASAAGAAATSTSSGTATAAGNASTSAVSDPIRESTVFPASRAAAARFLTQATFGPNEVDVARLMKAGYPAWLDYQFNMPAASHRADWEAADAAIKAITPTASAGQDQVWESFWKQAVNGDDQLRQRVAFALSEIFVVSAVDSNVGAQPRALAAWLDMLEANSFGTYRGLLEAVTLHPLMGIYLTSIKNQKADLTAGRIPDQNYARESMQLLSVGLVKLNIDGSPVMVDGKAVETYGPDDVAGLSRVYTGWSYACPAAPSNNCFYNGATGGTTSTSDPDRYFKPMVAYPQFHSTEVKTFLGVTIPAQTTADPVTSLRIALDTLANHPNVGPFIGKQLIQRLVTSNPSPAYVQDVASVFNNNGSGVRGDLKAVVRAILLHPEARLQSDAEGKLREPVLRLSAYLRAFPHASDTGNWKVGNTDAVGSSLGQTPLRAPSVFNFFRPGYTAPGTQSAAAGLVAPELQLVNESSTAGWVNYMRDNISSGVGQYNGTINNVVYNHRDMQRNWAPELALAGDATALTASVMGKLLYTTNTALQTDIATAVGKIVIPALNSGGTNQSSIDSAKRNRVNAALLLTLASPEFLAQK